MPRRPGSRQGLAQLAKMQGFVWGAPPNEQAAWIDGDTLFFDGTVAFRGPRVDARTFGAVGDGVNDDADRFQEALDFAGANGRVYAPQPPGGSYKLNSGLRFWPGQTIEGDGSNATVLDFSGAGAHGFAKRAASANGDKARFRGMQIVVGTVAGGSTFYGIDLENCSSCIVEDVLVLYGLAGFHLKTTGAGCFFNVLTDCRTRACKYGIDFDDNAGAGNSVNANEVRNFYYEDVGVWDPDGVALLLSGYGNRVFGFYSGGALTAGIKLGAVTGNCLMDGVYVESGPTHGVDASAVAGGRRNVLVDYHFDTATDVYDPDGTLTMATTNPTEQTNQLVNGGFEVWQRGEGPFTADLAYTADRWQIDLAGTDTFSVTRESGATNKRPGSLYSAAVVFVLGTGGGASRFVQTIKVADNYAHLLGRPISFVVAVKTATANAVRALVVTDGTGGVTTVSSYHAGDGVMRGLLVQNVTIPTDATSIVIGVQFGASCTAYLDDAMCNVGADSANYAALTPAVELVRCQRYYYEVGGLDTNELVTMLQATSATVAKGPFRFPVEMAVAPTITVPDATKWRVTDASGAGVVLSALAASLTTRRSCFLTATVAAGLVAGNASSLFANGDTAARITFVANP